MLIFSLGNRCTPNNWLDETVVRHVAALWKTTISCILTSQLGVNRFPHQCFLGVSYWFSNKLETFRLNRYVYLCNLTKMQRMHFDYFTSSPTFTCAFYENLKCIKSSTIKVSWLADKWLSLWYGYWYVYYLDDYAKVLECWGFGLSTFRFVDALNGNPVNYACGYLVLCCLFCGLVFVVLIIRLINIPNECITANSTTWNCVHIPWDILVNENS